MTTVSITDGSGTDTITIAQNLFNGVTTTITSSGGAADVLNVNTDASANTSSVSATAFTQTGGGTINYTGATLETIVWTGRGNADVFVMTDHSAVTTFTIDLGGGADTLSLTQSGNFQTDPVITGGAGSAVVTVIVDGSGGAATVNATTIGDGDVQDITFAGGGNSGVTGLVVTGANATNTITVTTTPAFATTINGGTLADAINVTATGNATTINGGSGAAVITVAIFTNLTGALTVAGDADADTLTVTLLTPNGGALTVSATQIGDGTDLINYAGANMETVNIQLSNTANTITLTGPSAATLTSITGGTNTDDFTLNTLASLVGALTVAGGDGADTLTVTLADNIGGPLVFGATTISDGTDTINNVGATLETVAVTMADNAHAITINNPSGVTLNTVTGGTAVDTFTVTNTAQPTTLNGDADADIFNVTATGAAATINGGAGADVITVAVFANLTGALTVAGDADTLTITLADDIGGTLAVAATTIGDGTDLINYAGANMETVNVTMANNANVASVTAATADTMTTINGGTDVDTITVASTAAGAPVTINGGDGADPITVTLDGLNATGPVTANGDGGVDTLTANDDGGALLITTTATTVASAALGTLTYGATVNILVVTGANDMFSVTGTTPATTTTVNAERYAGVVSITPTGGTNWAGTAVTITGTNFTGATGSRSAASPRRASPSIALPRSAWSHPS